MYKFIKTPDTDNKFDISTVEVQISHNEVTLTNLLEEFESFLKACSFNFDGNLTIEKEYLEEQND